VTGTRAQRRIADAVAPTIAEQLVDRLGISEGAADRAAWGAVEVLQRDGWIITALPPCRCAPGSCCRSERPSAPPAPQETRQAHNGAPGPAGGPR
jgi:hypothetical protein